MLYNFSEQKQSSDSVRVTDKSCDSSNQMNDFISSIAEKIHSEQVDIQTKRLFKRYAARKQEDMERRKQVWIRHIYNIYQIYLEISTFSFINSGNELS